MPPRLHPPPSSNLAWAPAWSRVAAAACEQVCRIPKKNQVCCEGKAFDSHRSDCMVDMVRKSRHVQLQSNVRALTDTTQPTMTQRRATLSQQPQNLTGRIALVCIATPVAADTADCQTLLCSRTKLTVLAHNHNPCTSDWMGQPRPLACCSQGCVSGDTSKSQVARVCASSLSFRGDGCEQ